MPTLQPPGIGREPAVRLALKERPVAFKGATEERREARGLAPFHFVRSPESARAADRRAAHYAWNSTLRHVTGDERTMDVVVCPYGRNFTTIRSRCSTDVTATFITKPSVPVTR